MKTRSQTVSDTSADNFIIDKPKRVILSKPKATSCAVKSSANAKKLQRTATAPGQQKVSDFYYVDPSDINNVNYLPDLVRNRTPTPPRPHVCIVISSDESLEGPYHVSSPSSETQVFEYPNLSPIVSEDECVVIADSK